MINNEYRIEVCRVLRDALAALFVFVITARRCTRASPNPPGTGPVTNCSTGCTIITCNATMCTVNYCDYSGCRVVGHYNRPKSDLASPPSSQDSKRLGFRHPVRQ